VLVFLSLLPVVSTPRLSVSATTTSSYVEPLDVSVERVEVYSWQTADGGRVTTEYRVTILTVEVNRGAACRRDAASAVQLTYLCRVEAGRQLWLVDDNCWTFAAVVWYLYSRQTCTQIHYLALKIALSFIAVLCLRELCVSEAIMFSPCPDVPY